MITEKFETLKLEILAEHILQVSFARPHASNAMNTLMAQELSEVFSSEVAQNSRCILLTGEGERAFCAGADLKERNGMNLPDWKAQHKKFEAAASAIANSRVPVIAVVNGAAFGGGLELILCCDFAFSSSNARFSFSEVKLGIIPGLGGLYRLVGVVGMSRAKQIAYTGEVFSAEQAVQWGIVNGVFDPGELVSKVVDQYATPIAKNAPLAVAAAKTVLVSSSGKAISDWTKDEHQEYYKLVESNDRIEGISAFNEKREPRFMKN